ncbi:MAG: hypothetical protein WBP13_12340 [Methylophilaceae bacterium]
MLVAAFGFAMMGVLVKIAAQKFNSAERCILPFIFWLNSRVD